MTALFSQFPRALAQWVGTLASALVYATAVYQSNISQTSNSATDVFTASANSVTVSRTGQYEVLCTFKVDAGANELEIRRNNVAIASTLSDNGGDNTNNADVTAQASLVLTAGDVLTFWFRNLAASVNYTSSVIRLTFVPTPAYPA